MGKVKKNNHAEFLLAAGTWANTNSDFLQLLPQTYRTAPRLQLCTLLQNQFPTKSSDPMKLFSDLISLATASWNQEPYSTTLTPLLHAIRDLQINKHQYRQKRALLAYNLYLSLSPKVRDQEFLSSLPTIALPKLSKNEVYPPLNHWVYESDEIRALWENHILYRKKPDARLRRHTPMKLEENQLQLDIAANQSTIIQDKVSGEIVGMVFRNFMPQQYLSILEWINQTIMASIDRKKSARLEDPGSIVQAGYSASSRSHPRFDWAKNLLSRNYNTQEQQEIDYQESSIFALFWNMARKLIPGEISKDIEQFLGQGIRRMDNRGKSENNTYTIQYQGEVYEFQQGELAPPVGFFASNYSRAIHKESGPHKYSLFWTTDRSLGEGEGCNFFISDYGIRIQGATNSMVAWQAKMYHGTSLAKLKSIDSNRGRGQVGLSIVSPSRLLNIWQRYMDERIDENDLEKELEVGDEEWE